MSESKWPILEKQQVEIIVNNMNTELGFHLRMQYATTFEELMEKGLTIERALIAKGLVKIYKDNNQPSSSNDKTRLWAKNKNVTNNGLVDTNFVEST